MKTPRLIPVTASRSQVLRGEKRIAWFFENKKSLARLKRGEAKPLVQAAWAVESGVTNPGFSLFYVASKRDVAEAHDRKKLKRWLREAVRKSDGLAAAAGHARSGNKRIYLMLRLRSAPSKTVNWYGVLSEVIEIGEALNSALSPRKEPMPVLRKKVTIGNRTPA